MGVLEDTLGPERAPQTERVNIDERAVGDSQSQVATTDAAGDTGSKTRCSESLGYEGLGAEQPSAGRGGRGNRGPADDDKGVAVSDPVQSLPSTGQSCRACCHLRANNGGLEQFTSVPEKSPTREQGRQVKAMAGNASSRASYHYEDWNDNWDSENGQAVDGLSKHPILPSRPIRYSNERQTTRSSSDNTTRKGSVPSQRRPDGNFRPASSEAQEVFGRGILRIQPHGPRNAYIITFLPDVVEAAHRSSASELCEESSSSTGRGPTNPTNTSTVDSVPGAQKHPPIDPLILADDGPLESGDLHQPFSLGGDPKPSEAICSYPDPPPLLYSALDQRDSIRPRQGEDTQSTSSPNDRHSVAVGNPPSTDSPNSAHGGRQSKSRKRKRCRLDGRPPKRVLGPHTSAPGGNPFAPLYTYLQSLPLDKRLQLLPWLLDDSPSHYMPTPEPDLLATGNGDVRPASRLPQRSESCEPHGSSRKGMPYSPEERDLLLKLRRDEKRPWSEVIRLFSDQFPGRSRGAIQVFWSTTLKEGAVYN